MMTPQLESTTSVDHTAQSEDGLNQIDGHNCRAQLRLAKSFKTRPRACTCSLLRSYWNLAALCGYVKPSDDRVSV
ncbi:hypothetical protein AG1IA_10268 [Rhizoctonia solani AG-1 IA]|uniref:Uncharacterized protein n=1 Tax=Thanatephorus cucumeris (strain AG1-IA) TaxID=983506 RepID=L8WG60_THACA|nr:hypothetical protein AG1IA_10268 [Rhizoctonia solani AG-1 IA]